MEIPRIRVGISLRLPHSDRRGIVIKQGGGPDVALSARVARMPQMMLDGVPWRSSPRCGGSKPVSQRMASEPGGALTRIGRARAGSHGGALDAALDDPGDSA